MGQIRIVLKAGTPRKMFSEAFKKQVVREYERGLLNKDQLMRKYELGGKSLVLKWCRKYGKFAYSSPGANGRPMKDPQKQRIKSWKRNLRQPN